MSFNSQWSTAARNARLSAIATALASGFLNIYAGAQPANGDTALTGQTQLVSIPLGATPFTTPASGAMSNAAAISATATATGTAGFCTLTKSDGTILWMGSVGTATANLILASTSISSGILVSIAQNGFVLTDDASIAGE